MPKRVNNIFDKSLKFKKMLEAYDRAAKNKGRYKEIINFSLDLANNITNILKELYYGKYNTGCYRTFKIYEPKERIIKALPFKDRVVQQWYVEEFIKPIFVPQFIENTYACINGRGVHSAVKKLQKFYYNYSKKNNDVYVLKCDIKKYFYSIDKNILYSLIERKIKDKKVLALTKKLIFYNDSDVGIPIGNYTSQYYANIYLNELDHFIKEKLGVKYYVRYMDDFILLLKDKSECKIVLEKITIFLNEKLKLKLNDKTNYFNAKQGITFCGYKVFRNYIRLKNENKKKINKKVKFWNKMYKQNKLDLRETTMKFNSWIGHAKNADCYHLIRKMTKKCKFLYESELL